MRTCPSCRQPLPSTKRSNAVYCDRKCKAAASEQRRPVRDNAARYQREKDRRLAYALEPTRMRLAASKRRARLREVERLQFTESDWRRLVNRFSGRCAYCGAEKPLTTEHVVPISRGGRHTVGNILPVCFRCNSSKRDRFITEWKRNIPSPHQRRGVCGSPAATAI